MNVPKLRFPEFSGEWEESELGKYAEEVSRINPVSNAPIMMISAASGFILQSNKYSKEMAGQSLKKYIELHLGEFAYNHGASKIKKYGACFSLDIEKARIPFVYHCFKLNTGNTKFFAYLLNRNELDSELARYISSSARMDGLLNISYSDYMKIKINVPSLPEQQKIADFLSTVDSIIASETKILNALQKKKKALMQKLFSQQLRFKADDGSEFPEWVEKKLGDCVEKVCVGFVGVCEQYYTDNSGIPMYRTGNLKKGKVVKEDLKYVTKEFHEKNKKSQLKLNDILMARHGENGQASLYNFPEDANCLNIVIVRPDDSIALHDYLMYCINSDYIRKEVSKKSAGSTQSVINTKAIEVLNIPVPTKEEQQKIADCLSSLDNLIQNQQKIVSNWQQRKKGLLQQMFI